MNIENLNEMADYLDKGDFGGHPFSMGAYQCCVLGHYVARELKRRKIPVNEKTLNKAVDGVSLRVFGIRQSSQTEEWTFAFGAQWGDDHRAAADRLRYLARHGAAPDRSQWQKFRTHPQPVVAAEDEPAAQEEGFFYTTV